MRSFLFIIVVLIFAGCNKDKFTTAPQLKYVSLTNNVWQAGSFDRENAPKLKLKVTDKQGDIGFKDSTQGAWLFIRRTNAQDWDSLRFPFSSLTGKVTEAELEVNLFQAMRFGNCLPGGGPSTDTLFFEMYVRDLANNKSNVLTTQDPVYFKCQ